MTQGITAGVSLSSGWQANSSRMLRGRASAPRPTTLGEVLLGPDDLSASQQPATGQIGGDCIAAQRPVPHISDIPEEECVGFTPVGTIVVEHLSLRELSPAKLAARAPARVIADPVWRIGNHQMRLGSSQHLYDIRRVGAV